MLDIVRSLTLHQVGDTMVICDAGGGTVVSYDQIYARQDLIEYRT